jgi:hypothetical protein
MQVTETRPKHGNPLLALLIVGLTAIGVAYGGLWLVKSHPETAVGCYVGESSDMTLMVRGGDCRTRAEALQACNRYPERIPI